MILDKLGIAGAGSFGTAIAQSLKLPSLIWSRSESVVESVNTVKRNNKYFPGVQLRGGIEATCDISIIRQCSMIFVCVPASAVRQVCKSIGSDYNGTLVICSKGVEESGMLVHEIVKETNPVANVAVLSGPNFARDMVRNQHCVTTIATNNKDLFQVFIENVKIHFSNDIAGTAVCGVFKNVLALACGLAHGAEINLTTQAAIVFRGFQEMEQLLRNKSGKIETLNSPAGLGDLWLTTLGPNSRNYKMGMNLVRGCSEKDILSEGLLSLASLAHNSTFCTSLWNVTQKVRQAPSFHERKAIVKQGLITL